MLLSITESLSEMFAKVKQELSNSLTSKHNPMKYVVFGTEKKGFPQLRYVVLRDITPIGDFVIFTDKRSNKVLEILENNKVSLLFYHPRKKVQVKVLGKADILPENDFFKFCKSRVQGKAQKAYSSDLTPSTLIENYDNAFDYSEENEMRYFSVITVKPLLFDILQLDKEKHIRFQAEKIGDQFQLNYLVP